MESSSTKKPHYYHAKLRRDGMIKDKFIVNTEFGLCEYCMQVVSDKLVWEYYRGLYFLYL